MGSESWFSAALGATQTPWQLVGEVSSFPDLLFAKTDVSGEDVGNFEFDTIAVESAAFLMPGQPSSVGCGGGLPRIAYFAELGPRKRDVTKTPRRFPVFYTITVEIDMFLLRGNPS